MPYTDVGGTGGSGASYRINPNILSTTSPGEEERRPKEANVRVVRNGYIVSISLSYNESQRIGEGDKKFVAKNLGEVSELLFQELEQPIAEVS